MKSLLGDESENFFDSLQTEPPVSIRINPKKNFSSEGEKVSWCGNGRYLKERPVFTLDPLFHAGAYYVQEASSMFLEQIIKQLELDKSPIRALDLCAAPGGKSTHLLSLLHENSLLISNEVIKSRINVLKENIIKWGDVNCIVTNNDANDFDSMENYFDLIVCDAPCSGEGLFRKDKDAIKHWSPKHVEFCSSRQKRIIADAWNTLKPGGVFVYCTCTYNEKENEDVFKWASLKFEIQNSKFEINSPDGVSVSEKNGIKSYRFYPHKIKGEGFCISVLRKGDKHESATGKIKNEKTISPSKNHLKIILSWFQQPEHFEFIQHESAIFILHKWHLHDYFFLKRNLKINYAGARIALIKGKNVQPAPELAFSHHLNAAAFTHLSLSKADALRYLKGATDFTGDGKDGYYLMMYKNIPLGFSKKIAARFNNLFPKEWYIRMKVG